MFPLIIKKTLFLFEPTFDLFYLTGLYKWMWACEKTHWPFHKKMKYSLLRLFIPTSFYLRSTSTSRHIKQMKSMIYSKSFIILNSDTKDFEQFRDKKKTQTSEKNNNWTRILTCDITLCYFTLCSQRKLKPDHYLNECRKGGCVAAAYPSGQMSQVALLVLLV